MSRHDLAIVYHYQGRMDEAAPMIEEAVEHYLQVFGPNHNAGAIARRDLAMLEMDRDRPERARNLMVDARASAVAALGEDDDLVTTCDVITAGALSRLGSLDEAEDLFAATMTRYDGQKKSKRRTLDLYYGEHLARTGRYEQAEVSLTDVYTREHEKHGDTHHRTQKVIRTLVAMYEAQGDDRAGEAARWRRKLQ